MSALTDMVMHATPDELINALVRRGAVTRRLAGGKLKVTITLDDSAEPSIQRVKRRVARHASDSHPALRRLDRAIGARAPKPTQAA